MNRPLLNLSLAILLTLSIVLGVVSPASAAQMPPAAAADALVVDMWGIGGDLEDEQTWLDASARAGERWIEVILSRRLLLAHEGNKVVLRTIVSIGKPSTPTVRGTFRIYAKLRYTRMRGPGYNLPNVPHTMYFYRGYAIHGAYWVKKFGTAISHGCVNVNLKDAAWLFNWASVGTRVYIHY